jgi:hypothetical protein
MLFLSSSRFSLSFSFSFSFREEEDKNNVDSFFPFSFPSSALIAIASSFLSAEHKSSSHSGAPRWCKEEEEEEEDKERFFFDGTPVMIVAHKMMGVCVLCLCIRVFFKKRGAFWVPTRKFKKKILSPSLRILSHPSHTIFWAKERGAKYTLNKSK